MSNLAEVCELLHWSLRPYAQSIADLGLGILALERDASEESTHLRRAAAYLVSAYLLSHAIYMHVGSYVVDACIDSTMCDWSITDVCFADEFTVDCYCATVLSV